MASEQNGCGKLALIVGFIAALIGIFTFSTGIFTVGELLNVLGKKSTVMPPERWVAPVTATSVLSRPAFTSAPTLISTATPTLRPTSTLPPTATPSVTLVPTPTPIPTQTPIPNTPPGTILEVGQAWNQDGFSLILYRVERTTGYWGPTLYVYFEIENYTGEAISSSFRVKDVSVIDNLGRSYELHECSAPDEQIWQLTLNNNSSAQSFLCHRRYIVFAGDYTDPRVSYIDIMVTNWSRIKMAKWRLPLSH